jgi:hypothetical protein
MDYGFKISQDGYDVKTTGIENLIMTSKANQWKVSVKGSANFTSSPQTITVNHGLGYTPAYFTLTKRSGLSYYVWGNTNDVVDGTRLKMTGNNGDTTSYIIFIDFGA